jgi:hypothetical protein
MNYMPLNDFSVDFLSLETAVKRVEAELVSWIKLREGLPQESWIEVRYEDIVQDWRAATSGLMRELNVPWSEAISNYTLNSEISLFSPSYYEVGQPVYAHAVARWKNYRQPLEAALSRLENLAEQLSRRKS